MANFYICYPLGQNLRFMPAYSSINKWIKKNYVRGQKLAMLNQLNEQLPVGSK